MYKRQEYLWGRDLLVAPVFKPGATTRDVYLPTGDWYDWWTNERVAGGRTVSRPVSLETMPIYVRAGAIVPFDPVRQYTAEPVTEPTTLRVYPGANGEFTLYDDDGISQEYLAGRGQWIRMTWNDGARQLTLRQIGVQIWQISAQRLMQAAGVEIAQGIGREIAK